MAAWHHPGSSKGGGGSRGKKDPLPPSPHPLSHKQARAASLIARVACTQYARDFLCLSLQGAAITRPFAADVAQTICRIKDVSRSGGRTTNLYVFVNVVQASHIRGAVTDNQVRRLSW